jgi:putative FmdB family regulatory protein
MPIYGYRCSSCGHQFEIQQRMSDEPLKACPKCQGKLTKMIYPTGVIYKGSGYYTTDYKGSAKEAGSGGASANGSSSATGTKPETKSESTRSETKSESKPESKSESKSKSKDSKSQNPS